MDPEAAPVDLSRETVEAWVARYEAAWRTAGTGALAVLFTRDAVYRMSPYAETVRGLAAIAELWERERVGPDEVFELNHEAVALEGDTAVVRVAVEYGTGAEYRDLWIVRFDAEGRCREFEEWPFWPGQPIADDKGGEG
jgi:ketosteroid isomerase-like protein